MCSETHLHPEHLILPLFIFDGEGRQPIASMPGQARLGRTEVITEVKSAQALGIGAIVPFLPKRKPQIIDGCRSL